MKSLLFLISLFFAQTVMAQGNFPSADPLNEYLLSDYHARVAFPVDDMGRVWVKGSFLKPNVSLVDPETGVISTVITLEPPFYTSVLETKLPKVIVQFCDDKGDCVVYDTLFPKSSLDKKSGDFSIMLYGCMEPFSIKKEKGDIKTGIFSGNDHASYRMRKLFQLVALNQSIEHEVYERDKYCHKRLDNRNNALINEPLLIIGTGDQVYVDAGYKVRTKNHPFSAWKYRKKSKPTIKDSADYVMFMNKLYNATYSFQQLEKVHHHLPSLLAIDDHELRDGWGSQKDEYSSGGGLNNKLKKHFFIGKCAYIDHQLALSHLSKKDLNGLQENNKTMNYAFETNGKHGYMLDLRSARNLRKGVILGEEQWSDFEGWLSDLDNGDEVIIVSSIPISIRPTQFSENLVKRIFPEIQDDVNDGWSSRKNINERNRFLEILTKYRLEKDIKPIIVSGDIHKSALMELWTDTSSSQHASESDAAFILAYEIVASGFSHEFIPTGGNRKMFSKFESQKLAKSHMKYWFNQKSAVTYSMARLSQVMENFGAIEFFSKANTRLHTFIYDTDDKVNHFKDYYIECDWDKNSDLSKRYRFVYADSCKQRIGPKPYGQYNAPITNGYSIVKVN